MNSSNSNNLAVSAVDQDTHRDGPMLASLLAIFLGLVVCLVSPVRAEDLRDDKKHGSDAIQIVTSVLGLEQLTRYSANPQAVGYAWPNSVGVEASYYDLGDSKFAKGRVLENNAAEDVGRRVNVKVAVDMSTPLAPGARLYSRVGVYLWDLDINYNRSTREFNSAGEGNSGLVGIGAALAIDGARLSFEYERLSAISTNDNRDPQRILMHVSSKF